MVSLRRDSNGNFIARKRLPDDVREKYGRLYGARFEAKFSSLASLGKHHAEQKFHEWKAEVEQRINAIRKAQRGEGINLDREQAAAHAWVKARQPAHSTIESWSTVFNALTRDFPNRQPPQSNWKKRKNGWTSS